MATFSAFDYDGNRLWSTTNDNLGKGQIDYIGNGFIMLVNTNRAAIIEISGKSVNFVKDLGTWGANTRADGLCINHSRLDEDGSFTHGFDGQQVYISRQTLRDEALAYSLELWDYSDLSNFVLVKNMLGFGGIIPSGVGWNGKDVFVAINSGGSPSVRQYDVGSGQAVFVYSTKHTGTITDMAYDGMNFWVIGTTNVRQFAPRDFNTHLKLFAHGLSAPTGLTTDGRQLITCN